MSKKRFIAGAVCPECQALDRIVVETTPDGRQQRCVACGFVRADTPGSSPPTGRLERAPVTDAQPLRIVDAGATRPSDE